MQKGEHMTMSVADRAELAAAVKDLLSEHCTEADVRRILGSDDGFDRDLWHKLAAQGVAGLIIDPEYDGVGLGAQELEAVAEVTGAALLPVHCWFTPDGWGFSIDPPIDTSVGVPAATQALADRFAANIAAHPADWHMLQPLWWADLSESRRARLGGA